MEEKDIVVSSYVFGLGCEASPPISAMEVESYLYSLGWKVEASSLHSFLMRGGKFTVEEGAISHAFRKA